MSAHGGMRLVEPESLVSLLNARDASSILSTTVTIDRANGANWTSALASYTTIDGIPCFNNSPENSHNYSTYQGPTITFGQYYTLFYHCKNTSNIAAWRTFHRNNNDHLLLGQAGKVNLGMYSNRDGRFRDSGYDLISNDWQTIIVTGEGDNPTSTTGTTTIYVNGENVGTCDRVGCGTNLFRVGWPSQGLGYWSIAGVYNKLLTPQQITQLHQQIQLK